MWQPMDGLKIQAKDFDTRDQLDRYVRLEHGEDIEANRAKAVRIVGTSEQLRKLGLSKDVRVHGVRVELSSNETQA